MINEDGTTESRAVMAAKGRDGSIWRFDLVKGPCGLWASRRRHARRGARPARARRDRGRPGGLGDERDHRRLRPVRGRPGSPTSRRTRHDRTRRLDRDRRGRSALPHDSCRLARNPRIPNGRAARVRRGHSRSSRVVSCPRTRPRSASARGGSVPGPIWRERPRLVMPAPLDSRFRHLGGAVA